MHLRMKVKKNRGGVCKKEGLWRVAEKVMRNDSGKEVDDINATFN